MGSLPVVNILPPTPPLFTHASSTAASSFVPVLTHQLSGTSSRVAAAVPIGADNYGNVDASGGGSGNVFVQAAAAGMAVLPTGTAKAQTQPQPTTAPAVAVTATTAPAQAASAVPTIAAQPAPAAQVAPAVAPAPLPIPAPVTTVTTAPSIAASSASASTIPVAAPVATAAAPAAVPAAAAPAAAAPKFQSVVIPASADRPRVPFDLAIEMLSCFKDINRLQAQTLLNAAAVKHAAASGTDAATASSAGSAYGIVGSSGAAGSGAAAVVGDDGSYLFRPCNDPDERLANGAPNRDLFVLCFLKESKMYNIKVFRHYLGVRPPNALGAMTVQGWVLSEERDPTNKEQCHASIVTLTHACIGTHARALDIA
jgi:hypothetical protein